MTEFEFIRRYLQKQNQDAQLILGIGDDASIIRPREGYDLCFSSDMLLKEKHFFADVEPEDLAWKVMAVNISDMAAMGAIPRWVLLSAGLPQLNEDWLNRFCNTLFEIAQQFGVVLIGGDTTQGDLVFNVTIVGELPTGKALKRNAAQVDDDIWVSGKIGLATAALNHYLGKCCLPEDLLVECRKDLLRPIPRVSLGLALLPFAHAAQDISDGIAQDISHILKASNVGAEIWLENLPVLFDLKRVLSEEQIYRYALTGGDDYELVFTAAVEHRQAVLDAARQSQTAVTRIGKITDTGHLELLKEGSLWHLTTLGFDHFG